MKSNHLLPLNLRQDGQQLEILEKAEIMLEFLLPGNTWELRWNFENISWEFYKTKKILIIGKRRNIAVDRFSVLRCLC